MSELSAGDMPEAGAQPRVGVGREIRELVKRARQSRGMTQAQLAGAIGVNRTQMNRIERGAAEISSHLARQLESALDLPDLASTISDRERSDPGNGVGRNQVVERLFDLPGLETVTIVVADDLDVYETVYNSRDDATLPHARRIDVIFPTVARERELFHGQPLYGHLEYQIKRLADLQGSEDDRLGDFRLFESDAVLASAMIARTRTGTECAYWPPLPVGGRVKGGDLSVASAADPSTASMIEGYVDGLIGDSNRIRVNEALCRVEPVEAGSERNESRFTRYFEVGEDQEEDVDENEGFAVALVLAVARCPRKQFGLARRIVTYRRLTARHDRERLSLFSNQVEATDIRAARTVERGFTPDPIRSRDGALAAALDIDEYVRSHGGDIPDLAFQIAAAREFRMFRLEISADRLRRVDLPPELQLIRKSAGSRRAAVAPRLFVLDLDNSDGVPELDTLSANAYVEEIGVSDVHTQDERLNDFLRKGRDCGFLVPLLEKLGVVDR